MTIPSSQLPDVELYTNVAAAVAALRPPSDARGETQLALPSWAMPPDVVLTS